METLYPNIENLCRLCLKGNAMADIFPESKVDGVNKQMQLSMRIMACCAVEVQTHDGLPKSICAECRYQLEKSYYFRKRSQAADAKLRKHIRLGKKSRVFAPKTDEEEDEDELEFEDSLVFIKEQDELRESKTKQQQEDLREKWELEMKHMLEAQKTVLTKLCKEELREEVEDKVRQELRNTVADEVRVELRGEVYEEVKSQLRTEVELEVRESLRAECTEAAKVEVRDEVTQECRQQEKECLLNELDTFLKQKRTSRTIITHIHEMPVKNARLRTTLHNKIKIESDFASLMPKAKKRLASISLNEIVQKPKLQSEQQVTDSVVLSSSDNDESNSGAAPHASPPFITEQNFYLLDSEDVNEIDEGTKQDEQQHQDDDAASFFGSEMECENFQLAASDNNQSTTTSYEIKDNGEIKFYKKDNNKTNEHVEEEEEESEGANEHEANNEENVMVFDFAQAEDDGNMDAVEFVNIEKNIILMKTTIKSDSAVQKVPEKAASFTKKTYNNSEAASAAKTLVRITDTLKTFKCDKCPTDFSTENSLIRHMRTHTKTKQKGLSYQCPECLIVVSCNSALKRHILIHTGTRPYVCEECGKAFVQREVLKRHLLTHSGFRPHPCPHCEQTFTQKVNLTQHINKHHMKVPMLQQHKCHLCTKSFNHASGLSRHLAAHSGVAFQCTECDRTFGDRSSVKRHIINVHLGKGNSDEQTEQGSTQGSTEFGG